MRTQYLISINISLGKFNEFVYKILDLGQKRKSSYVCISNVHMCIEAYFDSNFKEVVNSADIVTPDGLPLSKALKWLYGINQERVSGPDIMPVLLDECEKNNLKVFFYGSTDEVLNGLIDLYSKEKPKLEIVGFFSPPFRALTEEEYEQHSILINNSGAHLVFVALGCPKQEKWMNRMKGKVNGIMIGVGGAFPMILGIEKRAPLWMQKNMLEWLYRLLQDPKRLFKRYFVTNSYFVGLFIKEKVKIFVLSISKKK